MVIFDIDKIIGLFLIIMLSTFAHANIQYWMFKDDYENKFKYFLVCLFRSFIFFFSFFIFCILAYFIVVKYFTKW